MDLKAEQLMKRESYFLTPEECNLILENLSPYYWRHLPRRKKTEKLDE